MFSSRIAIVPLAQRLITGISPLAPLLPVVVFGVSLLAFHLIFGGFFPTPDGRLGHDYVLGVPGLLDGYLWFHQNGLLSIPWFTPSFCGGQAFYADPQSGYFSLPQFLTAFTDPVGAFYLSHLIMVSAGYWGMFLLCRRAFEMSLLAASVAAVVFMFNGFFSHRMIAGHTGYQAFMLVPLTAYLLTAARGCYPWRKVDLGLAFLAGLMVAYWLQSGLTTLMIPAALAVMALVAMLDLKNTGVLWVMVRRGLLASLLALVLSASKLVASIELIRRFPRTSYLLPGFDSVGDLLQVVFAALFYSSQHAYATAEPLWRNMQWAAMPHEVAFGVTFIPLGLMIVAVGVWLLAKSREHKSGHSKINLEPLFLLTLLFLVLQWIPSLHDMNLGFTTLLLILFLLAFVFLLAKRANALGWHERRIRGTPLVLLSIVLLLPFLLLYYSPEWNALLKNLPLIGSTTSPLRWLIILIPLLALWTGMVVERLRIKWAAAIVCMLAIPLLNALENRSFYLDQATYDPAEVIAFYRSVKQGEIVPSIESIADARARGSASRLSMDGLVRGESPLQCYNPLFGYRLERFRAEPLREGPITDEIGAGYLNLRNPACLLYPDNNDCKPWDAFRVDQRNQAWQFAHYRPYAFNVSLIQQAANSISILSLFISLGLLVWFVFDRVRLIVRRFGRQRQV
jgi:hypothetical protein